MLGVPAAASRWSRLASARGSLCPRSLNPSDNAPRNHSECANRSGHRYCYITEGYTCNITYTHFARARHCGETVPLGKQPGRMIQPVSQPAQVHRTMQPWQGNAACMPAQRSLYALRRCAARSDPALPVGKRVQPRAKQRHFMQHTTYKNTTTKPALSSMLLFAYKIQSTRTSTASHCGAHPASAK
jgi:hypothetical protein